MTDGYHCDQNQSTALAEKASAFCQKSANDQRKKKKLKWFLLTNDAWEHLCSLLPSTEHEHVSSSSVEARNTSRASWSEISKRSICSSMSTLTSMDEMLLMGANKARIKASNNKMSNIIKTIIIRTNLVDTENVCALLTSFIIYLQVWRGEINVHVVLERLLKEALSFSELQLLGRIHVREPPSVLCFSWEKKCRSRDFPD